MTGHHPGPPQFTTVGATTSFAPRDPDPAGRYRWRISDAPPESTAELSSESVVDFTPDAPGTYTLTLEAPDGTHHVTVRVFPETRRPNGEPEDAPYAFTGAYGDSKADADENRPRVRLDGDLQDGELVLKATANAAPEASVPDEALEVEFLADDRDPLTNADIAVDGHRATVPLDAIGGRSRVHAVAVGSTHSVADAVSIRSTDDGAVVDRLYEPPAWGKEMTLYEIFVRSFTDDETPTFEGIIDRLPELESLGVDCIWLTPVLQHDGFPHGYNITDFFAISDDLGTRAAFEAFVDACHDHGIRVLFDLVLNHSARDHEYYKRALEGDPAYRDWYEWEDEATNEPATYFEWPYIANLNHANLEVRRHLLDVVDEWAPLVDGFRCDMAWAVSRPFWQEIHDRVKAHDETFLLLDETIPYIADFHEGCFDVHFDTTLYFALREVGHGNLPADAVTNAVAERASVGFPPHAAFLQYIENHDETRYLEECGRAALEAAAGAIFTLPGIPLLYAGQEVGERERRAPIDWAGGEDALLEYYRSLIDLRHERPELGYHGSFEPVSLEVTADIDADRLVAYARDLDGERSVVVLNFDERAQTVTLPGESVASTDRLTDDDVGTSEGTVRVDSCVVLECES
ncbi:alpha-amylase family glycosyl hydrolase [Halobacteria archaeon AArc-curdl1]|uniref:Alpha-amylase family glycosyl hydrolase n=1 Tax=Natronosalvus hydrolyticus TaxID=2979988 RepID=A0AAP3E6P0_9EURY|nr:alpha-amylase family glycosyl hydrolase [Halobacteria archaeon AArc-curdl1]